MARFDSIVDMIGDTPLLDVSRLSPNPSVQILAKLEGHNPGGSVKDRAAKSMVEEAEKGGLLGPGQTIIESSSGNTGIALAMIARVKGHPLKVVLPENVSVERRQLLEVWGAEIITSPGSEGSNGAMRMAQRLAKEHPEWWFPYQYGNLANPKDEPSFDDLKVLPMRLSTRSTGLARRAETAASGSVPATERVVASVPGGRASGDRRRRVRSISGRSFGSRFCPRLCSHLCALT